MSPGNARGGASDLGAIVKEDFLRFRMKSPDNIMHFQLFWSLRKRKRMAEKEEDSNSEQVSDSTFIQS